jgi:hypothetical protein
VGDQYETAGGKVFATSVTPTLSMPLLRIRGNPFGISFAEEGSTPRQLSTGE